MRELLRRAVVTLQRAFEARTLERRMLLAEEARRAFEAAQRAHGLGRTAGMSRDELQAFEARLRQLEELIADDARR